MGENKVFPSPVLGQDGVTLRGLRDSDAPDIAIAGGDIETQKWLPLPRPYTLADANRFIDEIAVVTQALDLLSRWVILEQGFVRVEVRVAVENFSSQRVAEKAGFIREGTAREAGRVHDGRVDLVIYSRVLGDIAKESE